MTELFSQFSAFAVFLAIAAIGFLFLLVSLIFGEVFEHFGDGISITISATAVPAFSASAS